MSQETSTSWTKAMLTSSSCSITSIASKFSLLQEPKTTMVDERLIDKQTGVISDAVIKLTGSKTSKWYPDFLRMVVYEDYATTMSTNP